MERARIPMSILKTASMCGPIVVAMDLVHGFIVARRNLQTPADLANLEDALRESGEPACRRLMSILGGGTQKQEPVVDRPEALREPVSVPLADWKDNGKARLFLMNSSKPTIIRVIGMPFAFRAHWVPAPNGTTGTLVPHVDGCPLCAFRTPERMSLVPVLRKAEGRAVPGFLLAQEDLRAKIACQLAGRNPTDFDLVLYFAPFQEGLCSVYKSPPEAILDDLVKAAQIVCADPDGFIANAFGGGQSDSRPVRAPMFIVEGHFSDEARLRALVK